MLDDFEMFLVNDGSTDSTGEIMERYAGQEQRRIHVIHHPKPLGVGAGFLDALGRTRLNAITLVPGDHAYSNDGIGKMFQAIGSADIVITYRDNQSDRSLIRSVQSHALCMILNCIFGYWLRDYHSMIVYPVKPLRQIQVDAKGYGYQICSLVSLLQLGLSFVEVPVHLNAELRGSSRALRFGTYLELARTIVSLMRRVPMRQQQNCLE
jgi:glycosyltransferase involved in cell wall biosynthesis